MTHSCLYSYHPTPPHPYPTPHRHPPSPNRHRHRIRIDEESKPTILFERNYLLTYFYKIIFDTNQRGYQCIFIILPVVLAS